MNNTTYKVLKLISGENIICEMSITNSGYEISRPLLMSVVPKFHERGMTESLGLTRWVQPFTEQKYFKIDKHHVIVQCDASPDLVKYYEFVLNKYEEDILENRIDPQEELEEEYAEILDAIEVEQKKTIH